MKLKLTRRQILGGSALAVAGAAAYRLGPWSRPLGANADVRLGVVGVRGKGADHIKNFREIPGCRVVALCDVDSEFLDREAAILKQANEPVATYADIRKMLENPDIDGVVVATPNHWHALMGVWTLEAGKHLYVEKPIAHSIWEGQRLVEASKKSGLVVQAGLQRRSDLAYLEAKEWLDAGNLGAIKRFRAINYKHRKGILKRSKPISLPPTLDYDLWCGPAAREVLYRSYVHNDWHWCWNTGNGDIANNAIHFVDAARWLAGTEGLPAQTQSVGGRFAHHNDAGETPNTQLSIFGYPIPITCEVRNLTRSPKSMAMDAVRGIREGVVVECEGGHLAWPLAYDLDGKRIQRFRSFGGHGHRVNWLRAIVDNAPEAVNAPIEEGQISTALCHLANLSHRIESGEPGTSGHDLSSNDVALSETMSDMIEHLRGHDFDVPGDGLVRGEVINTNGKAIVGDNAKRAGAVDKRALREPYTFA